MMVARRRIIIVYNPRSSRAIRVEKEVLAPWREVSSVTVGKYRVIATNVDDNAERLAKILLDGDEVLAAGGDATATIALNGIMLSKKKAKLAVLPYGNFNDTARTMNTLCKKGVTHFYPLEAWVDGKHWRFAASYFTVGMLAESTMIFDRKEERQYLQEHGGGLFYSIKRLERWYFQNRHKKFLPIMNLNGEEISEDASDYLAINGVTVAKVMRGGDWGMDSAEFYRAYCGLRGFRRLMKFMVLSMVGKMPGKSVKEDSLEFEEGKELVIQAEGEYQRFNGVRKIEFRKAKRSVEIWSGKITKNNAIMLN